MNRMIKNGSASQNPDLALGLSIWVFWGACLLALVAAAPGHAAELLAELKGVGPQSASGPSRDPGYSSVIEVQGTAAGNDFGSAVLEYGAGEFPTEWGTIATLKGPISQGRLGLWETKSVPPGKYSVRLTVYSTAGVFQRAQRLIDLRDWRPDVVIRQALYRLDGGKLMVAVELANQGKQPAPAPIGLTVTGQLDGGAPVRLARWELGSSLPAGGQASKTGTVALPPTMNPGRYALAVILDEEGKIADGDRTNNRWVITPPVELGADLAMTQLKAEMAPDGRSVLIKDLVVNQGALPAAAATVLYYLSTDGTIQSTDTRVGQRPLPALPAGERSAATTPLPLPPGLQTGAYFLLGRVSLGSANND
jgi:hypothetical protein